MIQSGREWFAIKDKAHEKSSKSSVYPLLIFLEYCSKEKRFDSLQKDRVLELEDRSR